MSESPIPEQVRRDIENAVAAALNEPDLRAAVSRAIDLPVGDMNEVGLIALLVAATCGSGWSAGWRGAPGVRSMQLEGFIIATIQALDRAQGRPARPLNDEEREYLAIWERLLGDDR